LQKVEIILLRQAQVLKGEGAFVFDEIKNKSPLTFQYLSLPRCMKRCKGQNRKRKIFICMYRFYSFFRAINPTKEKYKLSSFDLSREIP
jgi:hypothetical protein